jgi:hypothetical protein
MAGGSVFRVHGASELMFREGRLIVRYRIIDYQDILIKFARFLWRDGSRRSSDTAILSPALAPVTRRVALAEISYESPIRPPRGVRSKVGHGNSSVRKCRSAHRPGQSKLVRAHFSSGSERPCHGTGVCLSPHPFLTHPLKHEHPDSPTSHAPAAADPHGSETHGPEADHAAAVHA